MQRDVYFNQHCPVCGRMLEVRIGLLGQRVYCQHCGGGFVATDESLQPAGVEPVRSRADELLEQAMLMLEQVAVENDAD